MYLYMNNELKQPSSRLMEINHKVIEVTKTNYTLDNGDVYEHTFDIDENITAEQFQILLDNAKNTIINTINNL